MIKKVLRSLKKDGLISTIKKIFRKIRYTNKYKKSLEFRDLVVNEIDVNSFSTVIIYENNFGWNRLMKQRPQQIASNLPSDTLIFYHTHDDIDFPKKKRTLKLKDNLVLIDLGYYRDLLLEELANHNNKYVMVYSTDYIPYDRLKMYEDYNYSIIYEYVDDINEDLSGDMYATLFDRHNKILEDESYVVCTASRLYESIKEKKGEFSTLITNGVNYEHFKFASYDVPDDMVEIRKKYKKLVGYYGALASWFDYELVNRVAKNRDIGIILIGQDYDKTIEKSKILDNENVFYLGKKDYSLLPSYGCNIDVFMIPFIINDITLSTSPVKTFEYMAMEKPIVTTALPECKKYKPILYSNNSDEFMENLNKAFNMTDDAQYRELLREEAQDNEWSKKANDLVKFINASKYNSIAYKVRDMLNENKYERIVIWRSPFGWNVPLFQRPQHISRQLAKQGCLVLYEITLSTDIVPTIKKQEDNLYLVNFSNYVLKEVLKESLKKVTAPKYLQMFSTNWSMSIEEMEEYMSYGFKVIYEYIDDINPDLAGTEEIPQYVLDKYKYAMDNKDVLIVTTAKEIYDDVVKKRGKDNMVFACNGVDYEFFQTFDKDYEFETEFLKVINNGKKNLCYYGALAKWFDYELIRKIDSTDKYNIILFGVKYDNCFDESKIEFLKNVHYFGSRDYHVLKNYASKMDILTIPFVINDITQATSPLKLFEYMALHKPIITTAMNECMKYKSVCIANSHEEFLELLDKCESLSKDKKYLNLLDKEAKENDWKEKANTIIELLKESEKK